MRHARLLVLLPALLGIACPGDWDEPLGPVQGGHVDSRLVGEWRCAAPAEPGQLRVAIVPFDQAQYVMAVVDLSDRTGKTTYFRAFTTAVGGHDVMNLKELGDNPGDGAWTYARFHFPRDGRLWVDLVRQEPLEGVPDDVESRRQAIGDLFAVPELWEEGYRCRPFKDGTTAR